MSQFNPGSSITIKVTAEPTSSAARKTLVRLLSKDATVEKENRRLKRVRETNEVATQRGGRVRVWAGRVKKQHPVAGVVGEQATVVATLDILQDLASVERFVEVVQA